MVQPLLIVQTGKCEVHTEDDEEVVQRLPARVRR